MVSVPPFCGVPALAEELPLAEEPLLDEQPAAARATTAAAAAASRTRFRLMCISSPFRCWRSGQWIFSSLPSNRLLD